MELNYVILAHKNHRQVQRLVNALSGPGCNFYIHIDKAVDAEPFKAMFTKSEQVFFIPDEEREFGIWGDFGIVKATINILKRIVSASKNGYVLLLSGQDYPLKDNGYIKSFLFSNYGTCYISLEAMPIPFWSPEGGMERILRYKINKSSRRYAYILLPSIWERSFFTRNTLNDIRWLLRHRRFEFLPKILKKRRFPDYLKPYGGEHWWALPMETVLEILQFIEGHKDYCDYHQDSTSPDEIFFHSIVAHLKRDIIHTVKPTLTWVDWWRDNVTLPVTFTLNDLDDLKIKATDHLFARKFDTKIDEKILDAIDIMRQETGKSISSSE